MAKSKQIQREQTAEEIGEIHGVNDETIKRWCAEGCPHSRGRKNQVLLNEGEVAEWKIANNKSGKPGRPRLTPKPDQEDNKDYWLARKYRNQCLRDEAVLVDRDEFMSEVSRLVQTAKSRLIGGPSQLAPQCFGQDVPTIERILSDWIESAINGIALADVADVA